MEQNKNVHKTHKRCKIFVKRLASKFQKDLPTSKLKNSHLESAFRDTVDSLPEESLREILLTNFDKYAKLLQKYCDVNKDKEETVHSYSNVEFPYNLYLKNGHIISDKIPDCERCALYSHVLAKELERDSVSRGKRRVFQKLEEATPPPSGNCSEVEEGLKMIKLCTGIKNPQVILTVMKMCLSKFQSCSEDCISKGKAKKARELSEKVQQFLMICHIRYHNMQQMSSKKGPQFEDLMAAYLSIYIDLCFVVSKKEENCTALSKRVCSFTVYLLSRWPDHMLDVLLQLTNLDLDNADIVLPLIRKALQHKPEPNNNKHYLKYILTVRTLTQNLDSKMEEMKQETLGIKAPESFLSWLQEEKPETLEEMPEDRKFKGRQITRFLLEDISEELESQLMDLLTDDSSEEDSNEEQIEEINQEISSKINQKSEKPVPVPTGASLFYLDTKGTGTNDERTEQEVEDSEESPDKIVLLDDNIDVDEDEEEDTESKVNGLMDDGDDDDDDDDEDSGPEDDTDIFFIDNKSNNDIEMVDNSDEEMTSVVQDTINEVKETLKNVRMTRHARKLFETSQVDRKSKKLKSSTKTKEVKPALKQKNVLNIESNPADTEQITKIASDKLSPKKSPLKSGILETSFEESSIIPDSDTEEAENNLKFNFVPEISSHLKQTPLGKKLAGNQKTPISRRVQKNDDNFDQSNNDEEENVDLMSPVISQVKVQPSRTTIESLKTELSQTTRLRTRSLTETESDKLGLDKKSSKLSSRKSITGYKPVVMDESLQMEPIEETKTANLTQNNSDTADKNTEHDVIVGGYSLRQTRKRTLSEASNSSVMSHQSVTEKIEKTKKPAKTPKSKTKTKIDDVVLIEMSDSETSSPKKKPESTTKTIKMRIGDIDITEMSDSEGLSPEDVEENTSDKTLLKVDNEITFSMEKTKDQKKSSRRKSEPGKKTLTAIKDLKSTKSRRYSLRHK